MYINFKKLLKRLKTEDVLDESYTLKVLQEVDKNLEHTDQPGFYWKTVEFLRELKQEAMKEHQTI